MTEDITLKIILLGEAGVGKTSLLFRFKNNEFKESTKATFIDHYNKRINVRGREVNLSVWDTAGQEQFRSIVRSYYRQADGVLLLYDVTDVATFHILTQWLNDLKLDNEMAQVVIAGNKNEDPARKSVAVSTVKAFAREEDLEYFEVSAKSGENVEKVFHHLTEKILIERGIIPPATQNNLPPPEIVEPEQGSDFTEYQTVELERNVLPPENNVQLRNQLDNCTQLYDQPRESILLHSKAPVPSKKKKRCC